ncbi:hypothetical protein HX089_13595 [Myroides odoratimimus]|uniref:hypothetical protein n=1 Tax=Myroides odoratimimus TaxID=76832 RepID=UPI0003535CC7|nr:hypothetical protein [Myroides odoratimimus]EPH11519.1 hypothetical protein HMPREF9713_02009 [Myroides odoratimimus CCUG 12700]MCO7723849.1 hypothetical protein [Myroides odoratimimus]MDM1499813.1 hypothetical protein [Myroides odoratimimus]MDM1507183.1 hypothetical protein [Myroides odoratimimus]MDM1513892.1 hypothetical protein [Myroides odoratimimus]
MKTRQIIWFTLLSIFSFIHSKAQTNTFYDEYYENKIEEYTFKTEKDIDRYFDELVGDTYMAGYTKTYTRFTKSKKDLLYILAYGEQDCFFLFYYDKNEESYSLVTTSFFNYFYLSPRYRTITYTETSCCGESPLKGNVVLELNEKGVEIKENYAIVNLDIPESDIQKNELIHSTLWGVVQNEAYNLRLYPSVENKYPDSDEFYNYFADNLLGKLKKNSKIKIIGERYSEERKWYYVEVESKQLSTNYASHAIHNELQNIRGWVSSNFITTL